MCRPCSSAACRPRLEWCSFVALSSIVTRILRRGSSGSMLRGAIEVEVSDGTRRRFEPGDLVLVTDTTGRGHVTFAVGDPPLEGLFVAEA